jgi:hypothetical protein
VQRIPSDQQIRNLLDPVAPDDLTPLLFNLVEALYRQGALAAYRRFAGDFLIAWDDTPYFASEKISCPHCTTRTHANGTVRYRHTVVTPVLLAPGQETVFPLPPAFVVPQDGHDKQDGELAASGRWLTPWGAIARAVGGDLPGR